MNIALDPATYWQLRALAADAQRLDREAQMAVAAARAAQAKQAACLSAVAEAHGFDAAKDGIRLDDDTHTLTVPD